MRVLPHAPEPQPGKPARLYTRPHGLWPIAAEAADHKHVKSSTHSPARMERPRRARAFQGFLGVGAYRYP